MHHIAAAFPSACGKTNLAMLEPTIPGWKVETVGDDIAWMRYGDDGRLRAINPEAGFFGVAPGTGDDDQRQRDRDALGQHHLHQRRAHRRRRRVVGGPDRRGARAPHRLEGQRLDARVRASPPRTRTRASPRRAAQCPSIADDWEDPAGVPIDAILFGGRRATNVPLVIEAARLGARRLHRRHHLVRADRGRRGHRRRAAPRPVRDAAVLRLQHGRLLGSLARGRPGHARPTSCRAIFQVNWFRKGADGTFLWPGLRRELAACSSGSSDRVEGEADGGRDARSGVVPAPGDLDLDGPRHRRRTTSTSCSRSTPTTWRPRPT